MTNYVDISMSLSVVPDWLTAHVRFPNRHIVMARMSHSQMECWRATTLNLESVTRSRSTAGWPQVAQAIGNPAPQPLARGHRDVSVEPILPSGEDSDVGDLLIRTGKDLCQTLFPAGAQAAWNQAFPGHGPCRIRLVLEMDPETATEVASIPFEALCCPIPESLGRVTEALVREERISVVRRVSTLIVPSEKPAEAEARLRVLVLACQPEGAPDSERLNIEQEIEIIKTATRGDIGDVDIEVIRDRNANFRVLRDHDRNFDIFYFIGHGRAQTGVGQILLDDGQGRPDWRDLAELATVLKNTNARLVLLNGCKTAAIAAFACHFPAVVGMQFRISDEAAISFARGLWAELTDTGQLDDAVWCGRKEIRNGPGNSRWEDLTPVLYMRSEDGLLRKVRPRISTESLPEGELSQPFTATVQARGGRRPYDWAARNLPSGLVLAPVGDSHAVLEGRPTEAGVFRITVSVTSRDGLATSRELRLAIRSEETLTIKTEAIG